jgi:hypothetical protein
VSKRHKHRATSPGPAASSEVNWEAVRRRKLKGSVIESMAQHGHMSAAQLAAARMLGGIWTELDSGFFGTDSSVRIEMAGVSTSLRNFEPIRYALWGPIYELVYNPWREEAMRDYSGHIIAYYATRAVVYGNINARKLDKHWSARNGTVATLVGSSLAKFDAQYRRHFNALKLGA